MTELVTVGSGEETVAWEQAVRSGRCPICFLLRREAFAELSRWVGGDVADSDNRRRLDEAGGFCNVHFWLLMELHSPQSGALVNGYIMGRVLERLEQPGWQGWEAQAAWLQSAAELARGGENRSSASFDSLRPTLPTTSVPPYSPRRASDFGL